MTHRERIADQLFKEYGGADVRLSRKFFLDVTSSVLHMITNIVRNNTRTELRGLGVFTWRPFSGHTPDGSEFSTRRLWFKSCCMKGSDTRESE